MKLIDKYLISEFILPFFYCFLTFNIIFIIIDLFDHLSSFIEANTPVLQIIQYYLYLLPSLFVFIAPISLLLGLLYSLWQLTRHNELTAMRASGINFYRLVVPLLVFGLLMSIVISILNEEIAPRSCYWAAQFIDSQQKEDDFSGRYALDLPFKNEKDHRIWMIRKFDLKTYAMEGIKVIQERPGGADHEIVQAEKGKYYDGKWWFFNLTIQRSDTQNKPIGPVQTELVREMTEWNEKPKDFINEIKDPIFLSSRELKKFLMRHKNLSARTFSRLSVDMHSRIAMPWTCLVVTIIGISCGVYTGRKGAFFGIMLAFLIFFCSYFVMTFCQWLGKNQILFPWLSAWLPNILFLVFGLRLLAWAR